MTGREAKAGAKRGRGNVSRDAPVAEAGQVIGLLNLCARAECDAAHYDRLAQQAARFQDWDRLPAEAEVHGLAPLLYTHLRSAGIQPPLDTRRQLQALYLRHRRANQIRAEELLRILTAFEARGIRAIVLKGAAVSHIIYPDPALRPMSDLDLLVSTSDALSAQAVLAGLGFRAAPPASGLFLHRHLTIATAVVKGLPVQVEIHHRLLSDYFDNLIAYLRSRWPRGVAVRDIQDSAAGALMERARPFVLGDFTAYTLGHQDMLTHLCQHLRSHVNVWDFCRLIWVADVVGYAERFAAEVDWDDIGRHRPDIIGLLSLLHHTTPLSEKLLSRAGIRVGKEPSGLGVDFQGWPRVRPGEWRQRGVRWMLHETLFPSEWWLRLRYNLGSTRAILLARWVRHPLHILAQIVRALLEHLGWPGALELAGQRASMDSRAGETHGA
jgi:hypothetical protein